MSCPFILLAAFSAWLLLRITDPDPEHPPTPSEDHA